MELAMAAQSDNQRIVHALDLVMRLRDVNESELARRVGTSPQRINDRHKGRVSVRAAELAVFAAAMGVPTYVLTMDTGEILEWFSQHPDLAVDGYAARDSNPEPADYGAYQPTLALFSAGLAA